MSSLGKRLLTAATAGLVVATGAAVPAAAEPGPAAAVDRFPTPALNWYKCYTSAECAVVRLPLDYDEPGGDTTEVALLRVRAKNPAARIGTLFVNPGGPGGPATDLALSSPAVLSAGLQERFDIVGVDPRGVGASTNVRCWKSHRQQAANLEAVTATFPWGRAEERSYLAGVRKLGRACSTTGRPLSGAMSTAEVVRDLEVLRRAVGDDKLSFLGFSYGSAVGQYYANMFPGRFRAIAVDGVIDPEHWVGTPATADQEQDSRLRSGAASYRALREILARCDKVGEKYCRFAAGNPVKNFERIAVRLRQKPLVVTDEYGGFTLTYPAFVMAVLGGMYAADAADSVTGLAASVWALLHPPSAGGAAAALRTGMRDARSRPGRDFPYVNSVDAFSGVLCTDALHPRDAAQWPALAAAADKRAPYFGRSWVWGSAQCARDTWTVRDEDAYMGPWNKDTAAPVLFVGAKWDPATNYDDAVSASRRLPKGALLTSTNWGHTSYTSSACVAGHVETYLITGRPPARGTVCAGEYQPFARPL